MTDQSRTLLQFMDRVWNAGDVAAVDDFVADSYTIHSDPGDPWDGQTLSRDGFKQRLVASRQPFPDLRFEISDIVPGDDRVAISWTMHGTQTGSAGTQPPSGRAISAQGMTIYYLSDGRITGHRQVVDRLSLTRQLGLAG
jgi:steroid delta-isomerase-like uncharacterized protein